MERAVQERRFRPLGSHREIESDFRLVAATNRDLDGMVSDGTFRQDLLFRLRSFAPKPAAFRGSPNPASMPF